MYRVSILLLIVTLFFGACRILGFSKNKPEIVAYEFLDHLQKLEYADAKKYGTDNTNQILEMMESLLAVVADSQDKPTPKNAEIIIQKCNVDGDVAVCSYTTDGVEEKINLVKEDGKWLVDIKKENMQSNNN